MQYPFDLTFQTLLISICNTVIMIESPAMCSSPRIFMSNQSASVTLENIHKRFGSNEVLRGISMDAFQGDVISVLGPSGSGKSTLLRCINLLEIPDSGTLKVSGEEVVMRKNRRGVNQPVDNFVDAHLFTLDLVCEFER